MAARFSGLMDKRVLVVLLLLFAGVALVLNIRNRQELRREAAAPNPNVSLQIGTNATNPAVGATFPVDVTMSFTGTTGSRNVYGVDLKFTFDQAKLEVASIARGTGLGDGCTSGSSLPVVLAPVVSETDCTFKATGTGGVIPTANSSGVLEFGVVPFDWNASSSATYQPTPINLAAGTAMKVSTVTFRVKAGAAGTANVTLVGTGTSTVDTNVAGISSVANGSEVGDVLSSINPAAGINVTIGGGVTPTTTATPTPGGQCPASLDVNGDGIFNVGDYAAIVANYGCSPVGSPSCPASLDVNGDGIFNVGDYAAIVANYASCAH